MPKIWNIADCGLGKGSVGHHYWENLALNAELVRRGAEVRIICYEDLPADRFSEAQIIPAFRQFFYSHPSYDPFWGPTENFVIHNRRFDRDLSSVDPKVFADAVTLFPTLDENHLLGFLRWFARFPQQVRPKSAVVLHGLNDWNSSNIAERFYRAIWREAPAEVKKHVRIAVRSASSAVAFESILGTKPTVLPAPVNVLHEASAEVPAGPVTISFVGGARQDRNIAMLPAIVKACEGSGVRFFIQLKGEDPSLDARSLETLVGRPDVRLRMGMMQAREYQEAIARSIVLLPYRADFYRTRISGVYVDAKCVGAPVIVPAGSWMSEEVEAGGTGLAFPECTPEAIAQTIARAAREYTRLRANAAAAGQRLRREHSVARHIEAIEGMFA